MLLDRFTQIKYQDNMSKKLINPEELYDGTVYGMSQATFETESGLVFVSGQVDETRENSVEGQARKALDNLKIVLAAAGSLVEQLLQIRVYIRGELGEHMETLAPILSSFLGESRPAFTGTWRSFPRMTINTC